MAIFIGRRPDSAFTRVPNSWARDPKLTTKAKGLLLYFLSHEDGYQLSMPQVLAENADGRDALYKTIAELVERGYMRRDQKRGPGGKVGAVDYFVADAPGQTASGFTASGESGSGADLGKQDVSAGETASWKTVSGSAVSGKPASKKTRVKKTKVLEDDQTISLSASNDGSAPSSAAPQPEPEREKRDASQQPNTETPNPIHRLLLDAGCPTEKLDEVHGELIARHEPRSNAWWRTVVKNEDLPDLVAEVLEDLKPLRPAATDDSRCGRHPGQKAGNCGPCAGERHGQEPAASIPTLASGEFRLSASTSRARQALAVAARLDQKYGTGPSADISPADRRLAEAVPLWRKYKDQEIRRGRNQHVPYQDPEDLSVYQQGI